jgi:hypothetical protein
VCCVCAPLYAHVPVLLCVCQLLCCCVCRCALCLFAALTLRHLSSYAQATVAVTNTVKPAYIAEYEEVGLRSYAFMRWKCSKWMAPGGHSCANIGWVVLTHWPALCTGPLHKKHSCVCELLAVQKLEEVRAYYATLPGFISLHSLRPPVGSNKVG